MFASCKVTQFGLFLIEFCGKITSQVIIIIRTPNPSLYIYLFHRKTSLPLTRRVAQPILMAFLVSTSQFEISRIPVQFYFAVWVGSMQCKMIDRTNRSECNHGKIKIKNGYHATWELDRTTRPSTNLKSKCFVVFIWHLKKRHAHYSRHAPQNFLEFVASHSQIAAEYEVNTTTSGFLLHDTILHHAKIRNAPSKRLESLLSPYSLSTHAWVDNERRGASSLF